jgi:hypothetical protein
MSTVWMKLNREVVHLRVSVSKFNTGKKFRAYRTRRKNKHVCIRFATNRTRIRLSRLSNVCTRIQVKRKLKRCGAQARPLQQKFTCASKWRNGDDIRVSMMVRANYYNVSWIILHAYTGHFAVLRLPGIQIAQIAHARRSTETIYYAYR